MNYSVSIDQFRTRGAGLFDLSVFNVTILIMRARLQPHCLKFAYLFFVIILFGAVVSGLLTTDHRWMNWHFSRLGEGGMLSAIIFNMSVLTSAMIMFILGLTLTDNIARIPGIDKNDLNKTKILISRAFNAITVCLIGVAMLPFDRFPVAHNIFGYSMLFTFLALCIIVPSILPIFSQKFYIYGRLVILATVVCYILFIILGVITLLTVEFIIFLFIYGWLLLFVNGVMNKIPVAELDSTLTR